MDTHWNLTSTEHDPNPCRRTPLSNHSSVLMSLPTWYCTCLHSKVSKVSTWVVSTTTKNESVFTGCDLSDL
eukprot:m.15351 g.15351  ORF g.15351 m.15351 type:complete len:71 (-) comp8633_c0_seq1:75-287(-)